MGKPELPRGYLGAQSKFGDFGLATHSHDNPEIDLVGNEVILMILIALVV